MAEQKLSDEVKAVLEERMKAKKGKSPNGATLADVQAAQMEVERRKAGGKAKQEDAAKPAAVATGTFTTPKGDQVVVEKKRGRGSYLP